VPLLGEMEVDSGRDKRGTLHGVLLGQDFLHPIMSGLIELAFSLEGAYLWNGKTIFTSKFAPDSDSDSD